MNPAKSYKRLRHTRGYGVHSPFAYMLVKEVVRPGRDYAYYAYDDIDSALESLPARKYRREARILLRLAARLGVRSAFVPQKVAGPYRAALLGADSRMRVVTALADIDSCRLVGSTGDYVPLDTLLRLVNTPGRIIAFRQVPDGWGRRLYDALEEGVVFYGRENIIVICRPGMQKVAYSICI